MKVGKLYRFTEMAKQLLSSEAAEKNWPQSVSVYLPQAYKHREYSYDLQVVVLGREDIVISSTTSTFKVKVLLPDGEFGIMYMNKSEWEEVVS